MMETRSDANLRRLYLRYLEDAMKIYGETTSQVVFWQFEKNTGLARSEIYLHPNQFAEALQSIFGAATDLISNTIISRFKQMIPRFESTDFVEALRRLRRHLNEFSNSEQGNLVP